MAKKRRKRRLKKWVKTTLALLAVAVIFAAGFTIWTIYAQSVPDTEYRFVYEKPLVRVDETIRYDMDGGIFYIRDKEGERTPVCDRTLVVSEDGEIFHEIRTNSKGRLVTGWYEGSDGWYYYTKDHGWLVNESSEIEGQYYELSNTGRLLDNEWVERPEGVCWYVNGAKTGLQEDTLLFIEGEEGFYYLSQENGFARLENSEVLLSDGRRLIYDEDGHIINTRQKTEKGLWYYPVPESMETASETRAVPLSQFDTGRPEETMLSVNHRGYHVSAPENSLAAYMQSYEQGYTAVECDIQFTADGIPVLLHNETINAVARNADGSPISTQVHISSLTYEQVLAYDFGIACGEAYHGMKITALDEFLAYCKAYQIHPYLEMKAETVDTQEEADLLIAMADSYGLRSDVTWISFSSTALQYVINRDPSARIGYLIAAVSDPESYVSTAAAQRAQGIDAFIDASFANTSSLAPLCESYGVPLEVWTVNNESYVRSLSSYVSGITTDVLHADAILGQ